MASFDILLFIAGIFLLIKGADWVTKYASKLAIKWGISEFAIGATLVAAATSLPEISISLISGIANVVTENHIIDIATGTIIGSNITNIGLVLGLAAFLRPHPTEEHLNQQYFMTLLTFLFVGILLIGLSVIGGLILLIAILSYLGYLIGRGRTGNPLLSIKMLYHRLMIRETLTDIILSFVGGVVLVIGSIFVINSVLNLSAEFGVSEFIIALIGIAIGTSLPELSTSVLAALKGLKGISLGNIIGSNIANILAISLTALITTVTTSPVIVTSSIIMLIFTVVFLLFAKTRLKISTKEGSALLLLYGVFLASQIVYVL